MSKRRKKPTKRQGKKISKEISLLMEKYKKTGKIWTSRAKYNPKNKKHALKIASAIAYGDVLK